MSSERPEDAIVVPGISAPSTVACLRSLGNRGIRTIVVSEDSDTPAFSSKYCDETVRTSDPNEDLERYGRLLVDLASRDSVRTIIPVREPDIYYLAKHKDEFETHVGTPWPDFDQLQAVQDRKRLFEIAEAASVGVPETTLLTDWEHWDRKTIVKSRYNIVVSDNQARYPGVQYVAPTESPDTVSLVEEMGHEPIAQEYMSDPSEYALFALFEDGSPVATFQHRQRRAYKYSGGPSAFREAVHIPELREAGIRLLEELDWHGLAMVEFKRDDGEFKLMEVNPRFWSSLPFSVTAGVDFPYHYYQLANGVSVDEDDGYDVGTAGHLVRGEISYLFSVFFHESPLVERPRPLSAFQTVGSSLLQHPCFDYLNLDDPKPFIQDMRRTIKKTVTERL
jgi:predicted ATP-grasp superfamily ATP-dependent carboligase